MGQHLYNILHTKMPIVKQFIFILIVFDTTRARGGLAPSNGQEPTALRAELCVVGLGRRTRRASRRMPMRRASSPEARPTRECGASARSGARRRGRDCAFLRGGRTEEGVGCQSRKEFRLSDPLSFP